VILFTQQQKNSISLTCDIWSENNQSYFGITCHFIAEKWEQLSVCLDLKPISSDHTASSLKL